MINKCYYQNVNSLYDICLFYFIYKMGCNQTRNFSDVYNVLSTQETITDGAGPFVSPAFPDYDKQIEEYKNRTWVDQLEVIFNENKDRNALAYRKPINKDSLEKNLSYLTYGEVLNKVETLSKNLIDLELTEEKVYGDEGKLSTLGLFARNCAEWFMLDYACQKNSITSVTFYSTLGDKAFEHIFEQTLCKTVCVSGDSLPNFIKYCKEFNLKGLENVVLLDYTIYADEEMFQSLKDLNLKVFSFKNDLLKENSSVKEFKHSQPDTVFTICYTSGTTNLPKGAKITQNNFFSGQFSITESGAEVGRNSVHISYLPLAHIMERVAIHLIIGNGGLVGFIGGDVKTYLSEDISIIRPTILIAVPRVLTLFHQVITKQFNALTGCKKTLFEKAYKAKKENYQTDGTLTHSLYDKLIFSKVQQKFGGRIEFLITASAPLSKDIGTDMKLFFSVPIVEAYGMTELTGAITVTNIIDKINNSTGGCLRVDKFKLAERKEMNYHKDTKLDDKPSPTGEVCVKGLSVFKGYFIDAEKTAEAFDEFGWLKTGDVGRILPGDNGLKIIDRVKEIFKLSQGEYIAPSKLENAYIKSKYVLQLCVHGNSLNSFLVCVLVPNRAELEKTLREKGLFKDGDDITNFFDNAELHKAVKEDFDQIAKANKFNSLEKIGKFIITKEEFTVQNELITPTMKVVRNKVANYFNEEINKAYAG